MRNGTRAAALILATTATLLAGCSGSSTSDADRDSSSAGDGSWPREIEHEAGTTEIDAEPTRIVSTSPSITGSLLAIDAPVVASAATTPSPLTDGDGFFTQWADVAHEQDVEVLYTNLELDLDAIDEFEPDLIVGSANGGDSTLDAYDQLSDIAPTVMFDYGAQSWQDLTEQLGETTGREQATTDVIAEYDSWVAEQAEAIELPEQPVTALVYLGPDGAWAFAPDSPQADLLTSLGFEYAALPEEFIAEEQDGANGVHVITSENLPSALADSQTVFADASGGANAVDDFSDDPLLANIPAVAEERVYQLGAESFRLDYYSARNTVELLVDTFPG